MQTNMRHFGTRETQGCSRVDKSQVQNVKLRHSSENATRSGETPLTRVETRVRRELGLKVQTYTDKIVLKYRYLR